MREVRLTELEQKIVELYQKGYSIALIMQELKCSRSTIYKALWKAKKIMTIKRHTMIDELIMNLDRAISLIDVAIKRLESDDIVFAKEMMNQAREIIRITRDRMKFIKDLRKMLA